MRRCRRSSTWLAITTFRRAAWRCRGRIRQRQGQRREALADFNHAIELNSRYTNAFLSRARLYEEAKKRKQARADFSKALEIDPDNDEAKAGLKRVGK